MMLRLAYVSLFVFGGTLVCTPALPADDQPARDDAPAPLVRLAHPAAAWEIFGGLHFWGDELVCCNWRIQRHVHTGQYRLLDPFEVRHVTGTYDDCLAEFEALKRRNEITPPTGRIVVVLHGLGRTRFSMTRLADYIQTHSDLVPVVVGYPSTQADVAAHAESFDRVIEHLLPVEELSLVGYSLGSVVIRHWLGDRLAAAQGAELELPLGRVVMLGPPNQGARRALLWDDNKLAGGLFRTVGGKSATQLAHFDEIADRLATPPCPFGILAGGKQDDQGWHPLLPGDDDGVVTVEETRLAGAADFVVMPVRHHEMIVDRQVFAQTLHFLEQGRFAPLPLSDTDTAEATSGGNGPADEPAQAGTRREAPLPPAAPPTLRP